MPLQDLIKELENNSEAEEKKIFSEAQDEATQIIRQANVEAQAILQSARSEAQLLAAAEERKLSSARLRSRQIIAAAKSEVIRKALGDLSDELEKFASAKDKKKRAEYEKLFAVLAKNGVSYIKTNPVILCRQKDFELAQKFGKVAKQPIQTIGGLIVSSADGSVRVDNTFESLLEEKSEALSQTAHGVLFKGLEETSAPATKAAPKKTRTKLVKKRKR